MYDVGALVVWVAVKPIPDPVGVSQVEYISGSQLEKVFSVLISVWNRPFDLCI